MRNVLLTTALLTGLAAAAIAAAIPAVPGAIVDFLISGLWWVLAVVLGLIVGLFTVPLVGGVVAAMIEKQMRPLDWRRDSQRADLIGLTKYEAEMLHRWRYSWRADRIGLGIGLAAGVVAFYLFVRWFIHLVLYG